LSGAPPVAAAPGPAASTAATAATVERLELDDGALVRLTLRAGKGNVLTAAVCRELDAALAEVARGPRLRAVILTGEGRHFSFGASVEEHLPDRAAAMLATFHGLLRRLLRYPVPVVAAVHGQCLGGGLELALSCTRILAAHDAHFGQPEVRLAVFAPAGSVLLPPRIGQAAADELLVTGRSVAASEALALRLCDEVCDEPVARAEAWARQFLLPLSPRALRRAFLASRDYAAADLGLRLDDLERLYVAEVVPAEEAREGLNAFLEKRPPRYPDA